MVRPALFVATLATISLAVAAPALAAKNAKPNWEAEPLYKTIEIDSGFDGDPRSLKIDAGGDRSAEVIGQGCTGFINWEKPDVDINYENDKEPGSPAGDEKLSIYVKSSKDTSLVVYTPDREWICADDISEANLNPVVTFDKPVAGNYNIWVGTIDEGDSVDATLYVTELDPPK